VTDTDLHAQRDFLLRSLDDLEAERAAGEIDDATYARLHDDYTARAASVLRALRGDGSPPSTTEGTRRPWLTAVALVAVAAVLAVLLAQALGTRGPGQSVTGNDPLTPSTAEPGAALAAAADADPDDYDARLAYARFLLPSDPPGALREYDAAARIDPSQPEPLAYGGWIRALVAQEVAGDDRDRLVAQAVARLDRAIAADDAYADAYVFKGLVLLNLADDPAGAVPMLQRFLVLAPPDHPQRALVLAALERAVDASKAANEPVPDP
jgi:tetratricopeptide (TPR) repeat protein